jgi:DNA mismatch repair ATPase MutS
MSERWKSMTEPELIESTPESSDPAVGLAPVPFASILFLGGEDVSKQAVPACFRDLILDQVVDALVVGRDEYDLRPFFQHLLDDLGDVEYRHEVFRDLERDDVRGAIRDFGAGMRRVRAYLTLEAKGSYELEKQRWHVDAAVVYGDAVHALLEALDATELHSRGLRALRDHLATYATSLAFTDLVEEAHATLDALTELRFTVRIKESRVTVSAYDGEPDFTEEIEQTFARFRQGAVESHLFRLTDSRSMSHVDARIAECVRRLFPAPFSLLAEFCGRHGCFLDGRLSRFDREVQFYLAYLDFSGAVARDGLSFSYPEVTRSRDVRAEGAFDLALAQKATTTGSAIVCNDFSLTEPERILVVTGPNQGGKTTFARMFGQLHFLAALGVPVPARRARLALPDGVFSHFEREEDIATLRGKLDDELVRIRDVLEEATSDSVVVVNEIFSSTTLADAITLGTEVLRRIERLGCLAVVVTFVDELSALSEATVSMVARVSPDDPSERTFRIDRRPADGRAYALALAQKYGLSYERLRERIAR